MEVSFSYLCSAVYLLVTVKEASSIFVNQLNAKILKSSETQFQFQFKLSLAQLSPSLLILIVISQVLVTSLVTPSPPAPTAWSTPAPTGQSLPGLAESLWRCSGSSVISALTAARTKRARCSLLMRSWGTRGWGISARQGRLQNAWKQQVKDFWKSLDFCKKEIAERGGAWHKFFSISKGLREQQLKL